MTERAEGTTTFDASPWRTLGLALLGAALTGVSVLVAVPLLPNVAPGSFAQFVGGVGTAFFGFCTVVAFQRSLSLRGPVVTLSPEGFRDVRVSINTVPWQAVESLKTWEYSRQRILVLKISDDAWDESGPKAIARINRSANRKLGADGYCITTQGLNTDVETLRKSVVGYLERYAEPVG